MDLTDGRIYEGEWHNNSHKILFWERLWGFVLNGRQHGHRSRVRIWSAWGHHGRQWKIYFERWNHKNWHKILKPQLAFGRTEKPKKSRKAINPQKPKALQIFHI